MGGKPMKNEHTPNWPDDDARYGSITISVKIQDYRGLSRKQVERICEKLEKVAKGKAKDREVSAIC
jgi:hypothetical protein